jgi:hypothetical protein
MASRTPRMKPFSGEALSDFFPILLKRGAGQVTEGENEKELESIPLHVVLSPRRPEETLSRSLYRNVARTLAAAMRHRMRKASTRIRARASCVAARSRRRKPEHVSGRRDHECEANESTLCGIAITTAQARARCELVQSQQRQRTLRDRNIAMTP